MQCSGVKPVAEGDAVVRFGQGEGVSGPDAVLFSGAGKEFPYGPGDFQPGFFSDGFPFFRSRDVEGGEGSDQQQRERKRQNGFDCHDFHLIYWTSIFLWRPPSR
ncbi:hypothetical protein SDC9_161245 [bioreactor metagenome]|uniref:Uncharacterized protein n=1 Tax=bioreactor metagenome TaxID=1076179 RepID=A0A645FKQ0_9ZZZZ